MGKVRAIFFDIGDTLVYDEPPLSERFRQAALAVGLPATPERWPQAYRQAEDYSLGQYLAGVPLADPALLRGCSETIQTALTGDGLTDNRWQAIAAAFSAQPFRRFLHPKAIELLYTLRANGYTLGAISDWDETLPKLLGEMYLMPHIDTLSVSSLVGVTKPDRRLFEDALHQAGVAPEEALHVGDWYALDIVGARAAGMQALLFDHAGRTPQADCPRVETFDEMAQYLRRL